MKASASTRERQSGRGLDAAHWNANNQRMMEFLKTDEARPYLVRAFGDDGARRKLSELLDEMANAS